MGRRGRGREGDQTYVSSNPHTPCILLTPTPGVHRTPHNTHVRTHPPMISLPERSALPLPSLFTPVLRCHPSDPS